MTDLERLIDAFTKIGYNFATLKDEGYTYIVLCSSEGEAQELQNMHPDNIYDREFFEFNPDGSWASHP